jgi:CO/xanthine dehydrogenase FAD-binding subunit
MISKYYRPQTLEESLKILKKKGTKPLGGGTVLNQSTSDFFEVVDLQALGLDKIHKAKDKLVIGATVSLQSLLESACLPDEANIALKLEAPINIRNMSTIAGALISCNGSSQLAAIFLAMDAKLNIEGGGEPISARLGDVLPLRKEILNKKLITSIEIPININLTYEQVSRTPLDKPIVCVALARWSSGRARLVIGGWGNFPVVAFDGNEIPIIDAIPHLVYPDEREGGTSAEYRRKLVKVLFNRCLEKG